MKKIYKKKRMNEYDLLKNLLERTRADNTGLDDIRRKGKMALEN